MALEPQTFVFEQAVNDPAGYTLVLLEGDIWIEEPEQKDPGDHEQEISEVELSTFGHVVSLNEAERIWKEDPESIYLVKNPPPAEIDESAAQRFYEPLKDFPGLFQIFAKTSPAPSSILGFANKFGFLTDQEDVELPFGQLFVPELFGDDMPVHAEPLVMWLEEIVLMNEAIKLWQLARDGDVKGLSKFLRWSDGVLGYWSDNNGLEPEFALITNMQISLSRALSFKEGDVIEPAIFLAATIVNKSLESRVSPNLEMTPDDMTPRLVVRPLNLLGGMWLQLARAIDGEKEYRTCEHCGKWLEIGTGSYSRARRFCSNACRVAQGRARKKAQEGGAK